MARVVRSRDHRFARYKTSDRAIFSTTLSSASIPGGAKTTPCRVCGRDIAVGDHCLARPWHVGFACVSHGWWRLDDLDGYLGSALRRALMCARAGLPVPQDAIAELKTMGILIRTEAGRLEWTECGRRLGKEMLANQKEKAS